LTQEGERQAALAPEVIEEAGGTSVAMVEDEPNVGRLSMEIHAEAREVLPRRLWRKGRAMTLRLRYLLLPFN